MAKTGSNTSVPHPFSKALMADAVKTPNVVEATNKPGLLDKLEVLKKRWVSIPCTSSRDVDGAWSRDARCSKAQATGW